MSNLGQLKADAIAAGCSSDGWDFVGPDGQIHRRRRNPAGDVPLYDVELMGTEELQAFVSLWQRGDFFRFARTLYPGRPLGYPKVAKTLWHLAQLRLLRPEGWKDQFLRRYKTLPPYAQFRNYWNVRAAALPGEKFRRHDGGKRLKSLTKNLLTRSENGRNLSTGTKRGFRRN